MLFFLFQETNMYMMLGSDVNKDINIFGMSLPNLVIS